MTRARPLIRIMAPPVAALAAALPLAACMPAQGGGPHDQALLAEASRPSALDGLSAQDILAVARTAVARARSGEVTLTTAVGSDDVPVSLTVDPGGDRELYVGAGEAGVTMRVVAGRSYFSGAYPLRGRLVPIPEGVSVLAADASDTFAELERLSDDRAAMSFEDLVGDVLDPGGRTAVVVGRGDEVAVAVGEGDAGYWVSIAAQGTPGPITATWNSGAPLLSANWDDPVEVEAPAQDSVRSLDQLPGA